MHLADRSLIERDPPGVDRVRFRMLQTIHAFAARPSRSAPARLDATLRRHAEAFLALAERRERHISTVAQGPWLDRTEPEMPQPAVRDCAGRSTPARRDLALRLVGASWRVWQASGHLDEGRELTGQALAMPDARTLSSSARMWARGGGRQHRLLAGRLGDDAPGSGIEEQEVAGARARRRGGLADAALQPRARGVPRYDWGPEAVAATYRRCQRPLRDLGDERGVARAEWALGNVALARWACGRGREATFRRASREVRGDRRHRNTTR